MFNAMIVIIGCLGANYEECTGIGYAKTFYGANQWVAEHLDPKYQSHAIQHVDYAEIDPQKLIGLEVISD